jgi:hypothetical protein
MTILSTLQYPHWLMVAGAIFIVLGVIGFVFRENNCKTDRDGRLLGLKTLVL